MKHNKRCPSLFFYTSDGVGQCILARGRFLLSDITLFLVYHVFFSSPEPSGSQGELIVCPWSVVRRRPHFSNIFSSETAWPIKAKFYVEPPWGGGTKVYINDPGHMTMMAATPIYGKTLQKSSSPEPAGRFSRNLVCSIGDSCPS